MGALKTIIAVFPETDPGIKVLGNNCAGVMEVAVTLVGSNWILRSTPFTAMPLGFMLTPTTKFSLIAGVALLVVKLKLTSAALTPAFCFC
jgi:hypothetical protein